MFATKKDRTRRFQKPRVQHELTTQRTCQDARLGCTALFRDSESEAPSIATAFEKRAGEAENGHPGGPSDPKIDENSIKFRSGALRAAFGRSGFRRERAGTRSERPLDAKLGCLGRHVGRLGRHVGRVGRQVDGPGRSQDAPK